MTLNALYPVLAVDDVSAAAGFFREHFPLESTFEADWYVSLRTTTEPGFQLAFVAHDHPSMPDRFRDAAQGVLLNFEVEDVDAEHARLTAAGVAVVRELRSEDWGQRHFIAAAPGGKILVDLIQIIAPSEAALAQYSEAGRDELFDADSASPDSTKPASGRPDSAQ